MRYAGSARRRHGAEHHPLNRLDADARPVVEAGLRQQHATYARLLAS